VPGGVVIDRLGELPTEGRGCWLGLVGVGRGPWRATGLLAALQGRLARGPMAVVVLGSDVGSGQAANGMQRSLVSQARMSAPMATRRAGAI
jgi:hypothetical protein